MLESSSELHDDADFIDDSARCDELFGMLPMRYRSLRLSVNDMDVTVVLP